MSEKYNIPEINSLDSMEGVEPEKKDLDSNLDILEKMKLDIMQECPLETIIAELGKDKEFAPKEAEDIIKRRYQNCIDCAAEIRKNFREYAQSGDMKDTNFDGISFLKDFSGNQIRRCSHSYDYTMGNSEYAGPFSGYCEPIARMRSVEDVIQFKPHCVIPTPLSAVLPSFMIKGFFREYCEQDQQVHEPVFLLPQFKTPKLATESEALENRNNMYDYVKYTLADADEDMEKFKDYLGRNEEYVKWIKEKYGEDTVSMERALNTWNLRSPVRNTYNNIAKTLESFSAEKEIRICILDEYAHEGRTIRGMETLVNTIFDVLKEIGRIPEDIKLKFQTLNLGKESYYHTGLSNGWLKYPLEGKKSALGTKLKSGSLPKHKFYAKQFKVLGTHLAREYQIVQELKK